MATAHTHPDNDPIGGEGNSEDEYWFYECLSTSCGLRFPAPDKETILCPICKSAVEKKDRCETGNPIRTELSGKTRKVSVVLDNLRSAYNVGSILRTSDGAGVSHAYLCGITPTPQHSRLAKTSLTAEIHTAWSYHPNTIQLVRHLKSTGTKIVGLETNAKAVSMFSQSDVSSSPIAVILGNEICGIDPTVLSICDQILYLPMVGQKASLNVAVSYGIAAYWFNRFAFQEVPVQSDNS